ncbi:MAG: DUF58 domain-containing protein [Candidatus Brocadiaceae bacterium]
MSSDAEQLKRLCARVRRLKLRARRAVNTRLSGAYASAFPGPGIEFAEFRPYRPGEEVRHIDWQVTSRRRQPYVRRYVAERELRVLLAVDVSLSMDAGGELSGRRRAEPAAAALALSAVANADRVGGLLFGQEVERVIPPARGERHALSLLRHLLSDRSHADRTDLRPVLRALLNLRRGVAFLLTDFCCRPPAWHSGVRRLLAACARRHELSALHLLPPALALDAGGPIMEGLEPESGGRVALQPRVRGGGEPLAEHLRLTRRALRQAGVSAAEVGPGDDYVAGLLQLLARRRLVACH